jgi:hypothetical protein
MIMMSIVVAIFTAPINLFVDYLFVDILSAPSVDEIKRHKQNEMKESRLEQMVNKVGGTVRRASVGVIQVARRRFGVMNAATAGHGVHQSMQIPESTMEAHEIARVSSKHLIEERRDNLEREQSTRRGNRSQILIQRQKKRETQSHLSHEQLKRTREVVEVEEVVELNQLFIEFVTDLNEQRRLLKPATRERYDSQWG